MSTALFLPGPKKKRMECLGAWTVCCPQFSSPNYPCNLAEPRFALNCLEFPTTENGLLHAPGDQLWEAIAARTWPRALPIIFICMISWSFIQR